MRRSAFIWVVKLLEKLKLYDIGSMKIRQFVFNYKMHTFSSEAHGSAKFSTISNVTISFDETVLNY